MVSINRVAALNYERKSRCENNQNMPRTAVLNGSDSNLVTNFMTLVANRNKAMISFGKNCPMDDTFASPFNKPYQIEAFRPSIRRSTMNKINVEASDRIYGKKPWAPIETVDAWMMSAETYDFSWDGGMGKVATDMSASFNQKYGSQGHKITIVTPLYTNKDNKIEEKDSTYTLIYKDGKKKLDLQLMGSINVPLLDAAPAEQSETRLVDNEVRVFKAALNNVDYLFFDTSKEIKDKEHVDAFRINKGAYDEVGLMDSTMRMAYYSKCSYELMKAVKEGKITGLSAPNLAILNDWQAGPVASLVKYMAKAEEDFKQISSDTAKYFDELPTVSVLHNAAHQGWSKHDNKLHRLALYGTLFQGFSADIINNAKSWDIEWAAMDDKTKGYMKKQYGNPFMSDDDLIKAIKYKLGNTLMSSDGYNAAMQGISLADRIVPVSPHFKDEILVSDEKANGLLPLLQQRTMGEIDTITPIIDGYSKDLIAPTQPHVDFLIADTLSKVTIDDKVTVKLDDIKLEAYDEIALSSLDIKEQNKEKILEIFRRIIERERKYVKENKYDSDRPYKIVMPFDTYIPEPDKMKDVPVFAYSGRVDGQKGMDTIFWGALYRFATEKAKDIPEDKLPIFVIGGKISSYHTYEQLVHMKQEFCKNFPEVGKRIVLIKDFLNSSLVFTGADMSLVPSVFEPCGLTQIEAMAKGALPIVSATGGLFDTVKDGVDGFKTAVHYDQFDKGRGAGALTGGDRDDIPSNKDAYYNKLCEALDTYFNDKDKFKQMQLNAMSNDFSWNKPGGPTDQYFSLFTTGKLIA